MSATVIESASLDPFLDAYLAGTPSELPEPAVPHQREHVEGLLPAQAAALHGCVLTPDGPREDAWLVVDAGVIRDITSHQPTDAIPVETDGILLPGLLDLHGHPEFNVFAPWEPPRLYPNRYAWRDSDEYHHLIRDPQNALKAALPGDTELRFAEIRALVGGVTAIQGASGRNRSAEESLVRNVDLRIFGRHRARTVIDLPSGPGARGDDDLQRIVAGIAAGDVDAFYVHLAEGRRDNARSTAEFDALVAFGALTSATVVIHGSALTREQLGALADAGGKLVWSPESNLRLYGETTRAADALEVGLAVALGADWLPSGSESLLAEIKVARRELANQGHPVEPRVLVDMVTSGAARIAGLGDSLGILAPGRAADVLLLDRHHDDPYESVCQATPGDVDLVLIGGDAAYGREDLVRLLAPDADGSASDVAQPVEHVLAWGKHMVLDTGFHAGPASGRAPVRLADLRSDLTRVYPPLGPIWA